MRYLSEWDHNPVEDEIYSVANELRLGEDRLRMCHYHEAIEVQRQIKAAFVRDDPSVWWFALEHVVTRLNYPSNPYMHLSEFFPADEPRVWFLPDVCERRPLVYDVDASCLVDLIGHCYGFEYYVVGKAIDWLIAENASDQLIICRL